MTVRVLFSIVLGLLLLRPESVQAQASVPRQLRVIFPVTCVGPGLANGLARMFQAQHGTPVKVISLCTGDAITFIKEHEGIEDIDVLIGHDLEAEKRFIRDGYAVNLREVFCSDFVLVGPSEDPAGIKGTTNVLRALAKIAAAKATFCSRDDSSGTHALEMRLWKAARVKPGGDWYLKTRVGTPETLIIAARKRAYSISQWATFVQMRETVDLVPMVEDPERLYTNYEIMAINPARFPNADYVTAMQFIGFLTSPPVQKYIAEFGVEEFGRPPFTPLAVRSPSTPREAK